MTKSKLERYRKALMAKFGDRTLIVVKDRFSGAPIFRHTISTVNLSCTADLREVERILLDGKPRIIRTKI